MATAGLSAGVLVAWLPVSALINEHDALSAATGQLNNLQKENHLLAGGVRALRDPAQSAVIARQEYQLVKPGAQGYEVLPPAGKSGTGQYAGDPGLQAPVAPGHSQVSLPVDRSSESPSEKGGQSGTSSPSRGADGTGTAGRTGTANGSNASGQTGAAGTTAGGTNGQQNPSGGSGQGSATSASSGSAGATQLRENTSLFQRIVRTLEFWR